MVGPVDHSNLFAAARFVAPLVVDAGLRPGAELRLADSVVLVAGPGTEPTLSKAVAACLRSAAHEPIVVLNRSRPGPRWRDICEIALPESPADARLVLAGREPRRALQPAVAELADRCEQLLPR
jgi:hypothetical protein